jgi:hypothetical protein
LRRRFAAIAEMPFGRRASDVARGLHSQQNALTIWTAISGQGIGRDDISMVVSNLGAGRLMQLFTPCLSVLRFSSVLMALSVADYPGRRAFRACFLAEVKLTWSAFQFCQEALHVQTLGDHVQLAVGIAWPFLLRPVPIQFDAVLVRVAQVERLTDAMVAGAVEGYAGAD